MPANSQSRESPKTGEARPAGLFAFKALAATLGGGLLSLFVAWGQTWYSAHLDRLHSQGVQGSALQEKVLNITGRIDNELDTIHSLLRRNPRGLPGLPRTMPLPHQVAEEMVRLNQLTYEWNLVKFQLRNEGTRIYGSELGRAIYNLSEQPLGIDQCNVLRPPGGSGQEPAQGCGPVLHQERLKLDEFVQRTKSSPDLQPFRSGGEFPVSFDTNFEISRALLYRYVNCIGPDRDASERPVPSRCLFLRENLLLLDRRVELVGVARQNLANAILNGLVLR